MVGVNSVQPQHFDALWAHMAGGDSRQAWAVLERGYSEPGRAYHNWTHIGAMLAGLDVARGEAEFADARFDEIELAIFFHDAVYDPQAKDNEAQSAALFREQAGQPSQISTAALSRIEAMILATQTHAPVDDLSTRLLLDLDLAVLGGSPDAYDRYAAAVRQEYAFVDEASWRVGRPAVLQRFLQRPVIYQTEYFRARLEAASRDNLRREIDQLSE